MYYAEYCLYGTRICNGRYLIRFKTREERDEWLAVDEFKDGNFHREAITRRDAMSKYPDAFREIEWPCQDEVWDPHVNGSEWWQKVY